MFWKSQSCPNLSQKEVKKGRKRRSSKDWKRLNLKIWQERNYKSSRVCEKLPFCVWKDMLARSAFQSQKPQTETETKDQRSKDHLPARCSDCVAATWAQIIIRSQPCLTVVIKGFWTTVVFVWCWALHYKTAST